MSTILVAGASLATFLIESQNTVSMGASGAVFGLFAVAVLLKLRFSFRKLVEFLVLGQFVVKQVLQVGFFLPPPDDLPPPVLIEVCTFTLSARKACMPR